MEIAIIGLGKMGGNMAQRLLMGGHRVVGVNRSPDVTRQLAADHGLVPAFSNQEAISALSTPRNVWVMVPSGDTTEAVINELGTLLKPGDTIIDGGNTFYKDDIRRAMELDPKGHPLPGCGHQWWRVGIGRRIQLNGRR